MYSKATYVKPYIKKFIRTLGINNVGTLNKPKMNVIYAILANNGIKPIDKNKYGVPLYQYRDLDGLTDTSIIAGFRKWKDDMLRKDIEISMRDGNQPKPEPRHRQPNTQMDIPFIDESEEPKNEVHEDKYVENKYDEKWLKINNSKLAKELEKKIKGMPNKSEMGLLDLVQVEGDRDPRYIAIVHGGLNGPGEWKDYFQDMQKLIKLIPDSWVIDLDVDVCDDVWSLYVGFRKEKLNEGASGYQPEDSDAYFDMCYDLSKYVFGDILKHLKENLETKNDNMVYTYLGILNHMLQVDELLGPIYYENKDITSKKEDNLAIMIIKLATKCYKYLLSDNENRQGWKDFEQYKRELEIQYKIFTSHMRMCNQDSICSRVVKPYHLHENAFSNHTNVVNVTDEFRQLMNDKGDLEKEQLDENWKGTLLGTAMGAASLFGGMNNANAQTQQPVQGNDTIGYNIRYSDGRQQEIMRNAYSPDEWNFYKRGFNKQLNKKMLSPKELQKLCPAAYRDRNNPNVWAKNKDKYVFTSPDGKTNIKGQIAASHGQNPWDAIINGESTVEPIINNLRENKMKKKIFLTEEQMKYIKDNVNEAKFPVDPNKVLIVKKFLDDNFQKGGIASIGEDGYPTTISIVALKGTDGSLLKNMDDKQLFYMLQDKFQHLYDETFKRDKLLKQIIKDWYKDKISKNGILTVNLI